MTRSGNLFNCTRQKSQVNLSITLAELAHECRSFPVKQYDAKLEFLD